MISTKQREARKALLGSSDAPAILGVDPHRSAHDVYLSKTAEIDEVVSEKAEAGNRLEPVLLDWAEEYLGRKVQRNLATIIKGNLCVHLDGQINPQEIVEAKTTGIVDGWGDEETDAIPDKVLVQTHHAFHVTGAVVAWVPVILARFGLTFKMYRVERNEALVRMVASKGEEFMEKNVALRVPPVGAPSLEVVKRIRRVPGTWADVKDQTLARWLTTKEACAQAEKSLDDAQATLIAELGTAEGAHTPLGDLTYFEHSRKGYEVKPTTYRTLKLVKPKPVVLDNKPDMLPRPKEEPTNDTARNSTSIAAFQRRSAKAAATV